MAGRAQLPSLRYPILLHLLDVPLEREGKASKSQPSSCNLQREDKCWQQVCPEKNEQAVPGLPVPEARCPAPGPARGPPTELPGGAGPRGPEPQQRPPRDSP